MSIDNYRVTGMTCEHCVQAVTHEISELVGVVGVRVDLVEGGTSTVSVETDAPVAPELVAQAVDEAGYALADPGDLPLA